MFFCPEETFLSNYADDNTLYSIGNTIENIKDAHLKRILELWKIGYESLMVLNTKKFHYICFRIDSENDDFILEGIKLPNSCKRKY